MANYGGQTSDRQRAHERNRRRAEAEVEELGSFGSVFETRGYGQPAYAPLPSPYAGLPGRSTSPWEQTLEQIVRSNDPVPLPAASGAHGTYGYVPPTMNPREMIINGHEDPLMADSEGFTVVQSRRNKRQNSPAVSRSPHGRVYNAMPTISVIDTEAVMRDQPPPFAPGASAGRQRKIIRDMQTLAAIAQGASITPRIQCPKCPSKLKDAEALRHHDIIHDPVRMHKFKCDECGKGFPYPKGLERHKNGVHRKVGDIGFNEFRCTGCGHVFARLDNLQRHQRGPSRTASTASSVRSATPSAKGGRRPSVRCRPPLPLSSLGTPGQPSYAEVAQEGHLRTLVSSPMSRSSIQSTLFSSPSSPFPQLSAGTAPTEFDWSQVHPRLRKIGSPSQRSYASHLR